MESTKRTTLENAQNFALHFYGSIGLLRALQEAKDEEVVLSAIAEALLQHPAPAEA